MSDAARPLRAEELLAETEWLRALAAHLVRDPGAAEDVAQETTIAALRRPPTGERRPWLAQVARNFARQRFRAESRRARHEGTPIPRQSPTSPAQIVERVETHRLLADIVATMSEPSRTSIVLRYYEDLTPTEIAAQLGVPAGTVRVRLHRGLAELRERLDEREGREKWLALVGPLADGRRRPPTHWIVPTATAAALIVSGALLVRALDDGGARSTTATAAVGSTRPDRAASRRMPIAPIVPAESSAESVRIRGRVVDASGAPIAAARVSIQPPATRKRTTWTDEADVATASDASPRTSVPVDERGAFEAAAPRGRGVALHAAAPGFASTHVFIEATADRDGVVIRLSIGAAVGGVVTDESASPVLGARVAALRRTSLGPELVGATTTSTDGRFRIDGLPPDERAGGVTFLVAQADGFAPVEFDTAVPAAAIRLVLPRGRVIDGRVVDADGAAVGGARVVVQCVRPGAAPRSATTQPDGRFSLGPVGEADRFRYTAVVEAQARGTTVFTNRVAPSDAPVELRLPALRVVRGKAVADETDAPVVGVRLLVSDAATWPTRGATLHGGSYGGSFERDAVVTDAFGAFEVRVVAGGRGSRIDADPAASTWRVARPKDGGGFWSGPGIVGTDENDVVLRLSRRTIVTGLLRADGHAFGAAQAIGLATPPDAPPKSANWVQGDGRYEFDLPTPTPQSCAVVVCLPGIDVRSAPIRVVAGERVEIPPIDLPTPAGVARGRVVGASGSPMRGLRVTIAGPADVVTATTDDRGAFELRGLFPGRARVCVWDDERVVASMDDVEVSAGEIEIPPIEVDAAEALHGVVVDDAGVVVPAARVLFGSSNDSYAETSTDASGSFELPALAPGPGTLEVMRTGHVAGARTHVTVPIAAPMRIELPRERRLAGRVLDENGAPVARWVVDAVDLRRAADAGGRGEALLDAQGRFDIGGLGAGPFRLLVGGAEFDDVVPGAADLELRLAPASPIRGVVVDSAGRPAGNRFVSARRDDLPARGAATELDPEGARRRTTDKDGRFDLGPYRGGAFAVWATESETHTAAVVRGVRPGASVELRLAPTRDIDGVLLSADGSPTAGRVLVAPRGWYGPTLTAHPGADGRFRVEGLPAGPLSASASTEDGSQAVELDVEDPGLGEVRITMRPTGRPQAERAPDASEPRASKK